MSNPTINAYKDRLSEKIDEYFEKERKVFENQLKKADLHDSLYDVMVKTLFWNVSMMKKELKKLLREVE